MVSKCWFITSVCPSVCRCFEVDRANRVSNNFASELQTALVHLGSRSLMIREGIPKNLMTRLNSRMADSSAVTSVVVAMKCAYFVSLSTTTRMHSVEVMVYQYDKLFGYGCWMTSIPTMN